MDSNSKRPDCPLRQAILKRDVEKVKALCCERKTSSGSTLPFVDDYGQRESALQFALRQEPMVPMRKQPRNISPRRRRRVAPEPVAVQLSDEDPRLFSIFQILLDTDQSSDGVNRGANQYGGTALHQLAASQLRIAPLRARLLLSRGADPRLPNDVGLNPLHVACFCERVSLVETLLDDSPSSIVDIPDPVGRTPLHLVIDAALQCSDKEAYLDILRLLLIHGANPNVPDARGTQPLWAACPNRRIMQVLLEFGADPLRASYNCSDTILDRVCRDPWLSHQVPLVDLLLKACPRAVTLTDAKTGFKSVHWAAIDNAPVETLYLLVRCDPTACLFHFGGSEQATVENRTSKWGL